MKKRNVIMLCGMVGMMAAFCVGCGTDKQDTETQGDMATEELAEVEKADVAKVEATGEKEYEAVTIENYNMETTYEEKPQNVVTLSLNSAEIIAALGEADSICAVQTNNNVLTDLLPEYYEELKDVTIPEDLNTGMPPTFEAMLNQQPDFVSMNSYYFYVPTFGTVDDYLTNGVNLYVTEGSYVENCTIENTYNDIRNLGQIFGQSQKAEEIIADMEERISAVESKVSSEEKVKVMAFDSMSENLYTIAGGNGLEEQLLEMAGAENVFADVEASFSTVSIEEIIDRNPDYIIIHNYTAEENDAQSKIDYLMNQKELSTVTAIQDENFIIVNLFQVNPGIQNVDFIEAVAQEIHADMFK
ncbi:MAG: ABC transporter substrate-binding protein [Roseburia sp.]